MTAKVILSGKANIQSQPPSLVLRDRCGTEYMAVLERDSFTTISITVSGGQFDRGDAVEVEYKGTTITTVVVEAETAEGGKWELLLRWGT